MAAGCHLAPRGKGLVPTCTQCHNPELREQWGCDRPSAEPWDWIQPCPFCAGADQACVQCHGSNQVPLHRCPKAMLEGTEQDTLEAAAQVELGILPDPGGWQDQPHKFVTAWPLAMREIQHWRAVANTPKK